MGAGRRRPRQLSGDSCEYQRLDWLDRLDRCDMIESDRESNRERRSLTLSGRRPSLAFVFWGFGALWFRRTHRCHTCC